MEAVVGGLHNVAPGADMIEGKRDPPGKEGLWIGKRSPRVGVIISISQTWRWTGVTKRRSYKRTPLQKWIGDKDQRVDFSRVTSSLQGQTKSEQQDVT